MKISCNFFVVFVLVNLFAAGCIIIYIYIYKMKEHRHGVFNGENKEEIKSESKSC